MSTHQEIGFIGVGPMGHGRGKDLRYFAQRSQAFKIVSPVSPAVQGAFSLAEAMGNGEEYVPRHCAVNASVNQIAFHEK